MTRHRKYKEKIRKIVKRMAILMEDRILDVRQEREFHRLLEILPYYETMWRG